MIFSVESNDVERYESELQQSIHMAAVIAILKTLGKLLRKAVPWWNDKCKKAVKNRNNAFRILN